jgi:hypothetical protein
VSEAPRFSIILPTHNRADVLPFAIRSALWQTESDFELLVAGDGCTDGTAEVISRCGNPRLRWFDLPKAPGIGYANRNIALREARGRYVAYLAHDDLWFPDHLARIGEVLDDPGVELAYSRGLAVGLDGRVTPYAYNLGVPGHRAGLWRGESAITLCTVAHRRSCLAKYGFWDETLLRGADIEYWHRIAAGGSFANVGFLPDPTSLHFVAHWRETNASRARDRMADVLVGGFLDALLPDMLRLPTEGGRTQQEAAWRHLASNPEARVREIRAGVVQLQDAMLWRFRNPAGLAGLRAGWMLATVLDKIARAAWWAASSERRGLFRRLRSRTGPREHARMRRAGD